MQLVAGSFTAAVGSALITSHTDTLWSNAGQPYAQVRRLKASGYLLTTVTNGDLAAQQADLTQQENALKTALAIPLPNVSFNLDDGSPSSEQLLNAGSTTGVRVEYLEFPKGEGAEYATIRSFVFAVQAEYPLPLSANFALEFQETLHFGGGYPLYVIRNAVVGPLQRQLVYPRTAYTCTQHGRLVGYLNYLPVPPPKFPQALKESPVFSSTSPKRTRVNPLTYQGFEQTYSYAFESLTPLAGVPTVWRG